YSNGSMEFKCAGSATFRPPPSGAPEGTRPDAGSARRIGGRVRELHQRSGTGTEGAQPDHPRVSFAGARDRASGSAEGLHARGGKKDEGAPASPVMRVESR